MCYEIYLKNGYRRCEFVFVICDIVFVYIIQFEFQRIKYGIFYFQYMMDICNGEKIIVFDEQMRCFIVVVGIYDEQIIFFSFDEVNLRKGIKVRIIGGQFEGYEGVFVKVKGSRDWRVVISLQGILVFVMVIFLFDFIEVIEELKKRNYD